MTASHHRATVTSNARRRGAVVASVAALRIERKPPPMPTGPAGVISSGLGTQQLGVCVLVVVARRLGSEFVGSGLW